VSLAFTISFVCEVGEKALGAAECEDVPKFGEESDCWSFSKTCL